MNEEQSNGLHPFTVKLDDLVSAFEFFAAYVVINPCNKYSDKMQRVTGSALLPITTGLIGYSIKR